MTANHFNTEGRIARADWWLAVAVQLALLALCAAAATVVPGGGFALLLIPAILWSNGAYTIRRLHDSNLSGWWALVGFVPLLGQALVIRACGFRDGNPYPNAYGLQPYFEAANDTQRAARSTLDARIDRFAAPNLAPAQLSFGQR